MPRYAMAIVVEAENGQDAWELASQMLCDSRTKDPWQVHYCSDPVPVKAVEFYSFGNDLKRVVAVQQLNPKTPIHEVRHDMGSVYTLVSGELIQHPIMADGSYDLDPDEGAVVDWERGISDQEEPVLRRIEANLRARQEHDARIYREDARP